MSSLSGLKVIEISGDGSAAWAAKHLADWGAEITILEPPTGTPLRDAAPYYRKGGQRRSATWQWLSRGKTSVRVQVDHTASARGACETADIVLIETASVEEVLGMQAADIRPWLEGKTTCVLISPFATDGPYAGYGASDLCTHAAGGWSALLGDPGREPLRPGGELIPKISGLFAYVASLIGLRHIRQGGRPQFIELSQQAVATSMTVAPWLVKSMVDVEHTRRGNQFPMGVLECADGYVTCPPLTPTHWELMCQLMGITDVLNDPQGRDVTWRMQHSAELHERVKPWLNERTRREVFEQAQAYRLPAAQVQTIADRLACPQLEAREFWEQTEIDGRSVKTPRVTYAVKGLQTVERRELREAVDVSVAKRNPEELPGTNALPFAGLRVLDLTSFWSGPFAMMLMGALGADVIKIESTGRPDPYRYIWAPFARERWWEWGPLYCDTNCDKRNLALDLTVPEGAAAFKKLIAKVDIVVSNFANRVMPNLGLANKQLLEINPRLIAVTMPGYGPGGPWEEYVGYAVAFEQLVLGWMTGYGDGAPSYAGGFCDPVVGLHTVAAIELALRQREETGRGTEVEVAQCETLDSLFAAEQIAVQFGAPVPVRRGNKHDWMAPHEAYRAAGDDEWITIAVGSDGEFAALTRVLGRPALAGDPLFSTIESRKRNENSLDETISELVKTRDARELERELQAAGVMACRVAKAYEMATDPGLKHIGFFQEISRELTGTHPFKTWPFRFADIDASHKRAPPLMGEHNAEVLRDMAGLSDEEIIELQAHGVIGNAPAGMS